MGGIFLRIYGGMILAILLISLLVFGLVQFINNHRSDTYRHQMAQGTMWLVSNGALRYQPEFRKKWLDFNSNLLNMPFELIDECNNISLSKKQKARLYEGLVVVDFTNGKAANAYMKLPSETESSCLATEIKRGVGSCAA